jgi:uncharacterized protein
LLGFAAREIPRGRRARGCLGRERGASFFEDNRMERPSSQGFGLGLRPQYYREILEGKPRVDWFEVISENFMVPGGQPLAILERIRNAYPIVMHGVSMSIASTAPLDREYL